MSAHQRRKGARWELDCAAALRDWGLPAAARRIVNTGGDVGDLAGVPVVIECKNAATWRTWDWLAQLDRELDRAGGHGGVWAKRAGHTDPMSGAILLRPTNWLALLNDARIITAGAES